MQSGKRRPTQPTTTIAGYLDHEPDVRALPALTAAVNRAQRRVNKNRPRHQAARRKTASPAAPVQTWKDRYPPSLWADAERVRAGDWAAAETIIRFIESDPWVPLAGYTKTRMLRVLRKVPLDEKQKNRLRDVMIKVIKGRSRMEFTDYVRFAT